ncbi:MAG: ABC transporter ATP-binding protein [Eubacteriales bacterium]|jgi:ATP-binding cassette subfamily B protein|nr:ABC transporter ATP-binding protein [Eubacteriales bacterium]MDD4135071.1 ABC transporter ATP-binding protein [Eubacteriales bacterium]NLO13629.1 ABC transporter ATP-binding protein [Clostridiales bacterium]
MKTRNKRLLAKLVKDNAGLFVGAALCTVASVFLGFMTPAVLAEVLDHYLGGMPSRLPPPFDRWALDLGAGGNALGPLLGAGVVIILISLVNGVCSFYKGRWTAMASENAARSLRDKLYSHLQELPFAYHSQASTGDLVQRCTSDVDNVRRFLSFHLMNIITTALMVGIALALMLPISAKVTLVSLAVMPLLLVFSMVFFKKVIKAFRGADDADGKMSAVLQENLTGVRVVRAFGQAQKEIERFDDANRDQRDKFISSVHLEAGYWGLSDALSSVQIVLTLVVCIFEAIAGRISVGNLVVFTSYIGMLVGPIRQLGRILSDGGRSMVALERIDDILRQKEETDLPEAARPDLSGDIVFDNVTFRYDGGQDILKGLSFTIKSGETVAILGATGSGKSTIALLLQRMYRPQSGRITIGGHDLNQMDRKYLRSKVGLVLQEPFLYSKTIYDNLRIAAPQAQRAEVEQAARDAQAYDFISESEKGWETLVGERGVTLSGGQKQRAAIARTLLKGSDILVFDDSLSAVDTQTDALIRRNLKERRKGVTAIIISHRILTLKEADRILVLEDGRLAQEGSHGELIARPGLYQRINNIQSGLSEEEEAALDNASFQAQRGTV